MSRACKPHLVFMVMLLMLIGTAATASADEPVVVPGEVLIIAAKESPGARDPELDHEPALRHRTFKMYPTMKLLAKPQLTFKQGEDSVVDLPNKRQLRIMLQARLSDGRYKIQLSVNMPGKKDYVRSVQAILSPGVPMFQAGQRYDDADLIVGVRMGKKANPSK